MAKRVTKKSQLEASYKRAMKDYYAKAKRYESMGFTFENSIHIPKPKRITEASIRNIERQTERLKGKITLYHETTEGIVKAKKSDITLRLTRGEDLYIDNFLQTVYGADVSDSRKDLYTKQSNINDLQRIVIAAIETQGKHVVASRIANSNQDVGYLANTIIYESEQSVVKSALTRLMDIVMGGAVDSATLQAIGDYEDSLDYDYEI